MVSVPLLSNQTHKPNGNIESSLSENRKKEEEEDEVLEEFLVQSSIYLLNVTLTIITIISKQGIEAEKYNQLRDVRQVLNWFYMDSFSRGYHWKFSAVLVYVDTDCNLSQNHFISLNG